MKVVRPKAATLFVPTAIRRLPATALFIAVAASSSAQSHRVATQQANSAPLVAVVQPYIDSHEIAGAVVLIADRNRILDRETIGYANIVTRRPMKADDLFWIASMSKAMTAAAVMMLVDEGKIRLDDPVEKYLPEFKDQMVASNLDAPPPPLQPVASAPERDEKAALQLEPLKRPITIRELLSHTAGLPFSSQRETPALDLLPLKSAVESYAAEPLQSQPGEKYSYSNEGINTAARIVEVVSGIPFQDFLEQRLFAPLGMKDTTFWPTSEQLQRLATSYKSGLPQPLFKPCPSISSPIPSAIARAAIPFPPGDCSPPPATSRTSAR